MTVVAKITANGQITIPAYVRPALHMGPSYFIAWDMGPHGSARMSHVQPHALAYLKAVKGTLTKWANPGDEEALRDL